MITRTLIEIKGGVDLTTFKQNLQSVGFKFEEYTCFGKDKGGVIAGYRDPETDISILEKMAGVLGVEEEQNFSIQENQNKQEVT